MPANLGVNFPSEYERLRRQVEAERGMTVTQRLLAVRDAVAAVEALGLAGGRQAEQLQNKLESEKEWQRLMTAFIASQLERSSESV
jgi:hypothetical protein